MDRNTVHVFCALLPASDDKHTPAKTQTMPTLNWIGKDAVVNHHHDVRFRTLDKKYTFGDAESSNNMIIHGDNLEALKALLPQYEGKIKCIYIDPPYNTGNENWVYNDNVNSPKIKKWLGQVVGKEAEDLTRHDKWLCMMYPRLKLLQRLLSDDGAIFISIDDNEQANLKLMCDEIFGARNFVGIITWESSTQPINAGTARFNLQKKTEFIYLYKNGLKKFKVEVSDDEFDYPHTGKLGKCRFEIIEKSDAGESNRDTMKFPILGEMPREGKRWQIGIDKANDLLSRDRIEIVDGIVKKAVYPEDEIDKVSVVPFWSHFTSKKGTAQSGKDLLNKIMGKAVGFDTVKPTGVIEELLSHIPDNDAIILDSFAGSGTTAHAVLNLNKQDGGNRKFILVEMEDYAENITAERVRRVINGYGDGKNAVEGTGGSFSYYELGEQLFNDNANLNESVGVEKIRQYIWYSETRTPYHCSSNKSQYLLGNYNGTAYYFYYEPEQITTLSHDTLNIIVEKAETYVVYADQCVIDKEWLSVHNIIFKKIPRDINRL
jgi:adenine-specific DNA-methyltransferase